MPSHTLTSCERHKINATNLRMDFQKLFTFYTFHRCLALAQYSRIGRIIHCSSQRQRDKINFGEHWTRSMCLFRFYGSYTTYYRLHVALCRSYRYSRTPATVWNIYCNWNNSHSPANFANALRCRQHREKRGIALVTCACVCVCYRSDWDWVYVQYLK